MSDSDDTDILLLIPPNYFIANAEDKLHEQKRQRERKQEQRLLRRQFESVVVAQLNSTIRRGQQHSRYNASEEEDQREDMHSADDSMSMMPPPPAPTKAYQFLAPGRKAELNHINARLHTIENEEAAAGGCVGGHFAGHSDISTISSSTVRTKFEQQQPRELYGIVHSTPKCPATPTKAKNGVCDYPPEDVLHEIDNFLEERPYTGHWHHYSDGYRPPQQQSERVAASALLQEAQATSLPGALNRLPHEIPPPRSPVERSPHAVQHVPLRENNQLISLSEIWGHNGQATAIAVGGAGVVAATQTTPQLKEEQLRRQHLEKTVHQLQSRLLEYQQRLSVAIEVDRTKDAALSTAQIDCKSWQSEVQQLRETLFKLESEQQQQTSKFDMLQKELAQAVNLATKFQEKNEKLENELNITARKTSDFKQHIEELELKVHGAKRSEECAINEQSKLKDKLAKAEYQNEKLKTHSDEMEKERVTLRHQKEMLQEYHQKQKTRADTLESQRKSMQETLSTLTENETALKRKIELQQKSLKSHYQQQLEHVVAQKLKEFQEQLDKTEEHLKAEARDRERLIAERAVKQLELINEKNELELNLLQEKHNEEVSLYRIQLANASKKIDDLELKLSCYKSKRADIAERLHGVMEKQWQEALEILTSPNQSKQLRNADTADETIDSPENNETHSRGNGYCDTPKTSKCKENNLNVGGNNKDQQPPPMDRLQMYIELLLSKSPSDFDKLDEILALTQKSKSTAGKLDKSCKRFGNAKPPWKA